MTDTTLGDFCQRISHLPGLFAHLLCCENADIAELCSHFLLGGIWIGTLGVRELLNMFQVGKIRERVKHYMEGK